MPDLQAMIDRVEGRHRGSTPNAVREVFSRLHQALVTALYDRSLRDKAREAEQDPSSVAALLIYDPLGKINYWENEGVEIDLGATFSALNLSIGVQGSRLTGTFSRARHLPTPTAYETGHFVEGNLFHPHELDGKYIALGRSIPIDPAEIDHLVIPYAIK